jgi:homoserine dehydrogenase
VGARARGAAVRAHGLTTVPVRRLVRIGLLGYGRIGQAVASLAETERDRLLAAGLDLRIVGALVRDPAKRRGGPAVALHTTVSGLFATRFDILIDVMGGEHPAFDYVHQALETGTHVVTANKTLMARRGLELHAAALRGGAALCFDAAVLAGVPFLGALARRPLVSAPRRIFGIVNGTSHFIAGALESGQTLASALDRAIDRGYAEPDSSADIGGRDAAEKLTIVLHLAGFPGLTVGDLTTCGLDVLDPADIEAARAFGATVKPIAIASLDAANPGAWVGPALIDRAHRFASLTGVTNAIEFTANGVDPITFTGPGAGPRETAGTILDDLVEAVSLKGRAAARPWTARALSADALRKPPAGGWYLRAKGKAIDATVFTRALDKHGVTPTKVRASRGTVAALIPHASWTFISQLSLDLGGADVEVLALPFFNS